MAKRRTGSLMGVLIGVLATAAPLLAQRDYLLRYRPGTAAAAIVDSLLAAEEVSSRAPRRGPRARVCRRVATAAAPLPSTRAGVTPAAPGAERLVALANGVPRSRWRGVPGVVRVSRARPLQRRGGLPDDPTFPRQWNLRRIDAPGAWEYTTGGWTADGREIVIGVIELDGIDLRHPDLADNVYVNPGEVPGNGLDDDGNGYADDVSGVNFDDPLSNAITAFPHGTHVAGVLAARGNDGSQAAGLNWGARLLPFDIETSVDWVLALDYLTALRRRYNETGGAEGAYVVVANCSFGADGVDCGADDDFAEVDAAIDRAGAVGILTVAATTNDTGDADLRPETPSSCPTGYLVSVTASDRDDELLPAVGFSPVRVDVAAPGQTFGSLDVRSFGNVESTFAGTSGATPQVAGTVALMYAAACERVVAQSLRAPARTALEFRERLLRSVDPVERLATRVASGGRLNARRAVEAVIAEAPCDVTGVIVRTAGGELAPPRITSPRAALDLADTLSAAWGLYRYAIASGGQDEALAAALTTPDVAAASFDLPLLSAGATFGFGRGDSSPAATGTLDAGGLSLGLAPGVTQTITIFGLGFGGAPPGTLGRRRPGSPVLGAGGAAFLTLLEEATDPQRGATVTPYRGYRLGDWLAAAATAAETAQARPTSPERPVDVFAAAVRLATVRGPFVGLLVGDALDSLRTAGVVGVFPVGGLGTGNRAAGAHVLVAAPPGTGELRGHIVVGEAPVIIGEEPSPTDDTTRVCTVAGPVAAAAQLTSAVATVARVSCDDGRRPTGATLASALERASRAEAGRARLDPLGAARLLSADCEAVGETAGITLIYPSLVRRGRVLRVIYGARAASELQVVDAVGRIVAAEPIATSYADGPGAIAARVPTAGLASGAYFLRVAGDDGARVGRFVVVD